MGAVCPRWGRKGRGQKSVLVARQLRMGRPLGAGCEGVCRGGTAGGGTQRDGVVGMRGIKDDAALRLAAKADWQLLELHAQRAGRKTRPRLI